MKKLKQYTYLFVLTLLVANCSSEDVVNDPNNIAPGPFSVTILETSMDGANIEWTESIDIDDDAVTYSIYLNDQLISKGGTSLSYDFTGLDPETLYNGYILADDGIGGTSQSDFFFETEPETIILTINASDWLVNSIPSGTGMAEVRAAGFEVPIYEDATSYQLEILDYTIVFKGETLSDTGVYTWNNESQNEPIYISKDNENYEVWISTLSIHTGNNEYDIWMDYITSRSGEAQVIITF